MNFHNKMRGGVICSTSQGSWDKTCQYIWYHSKATLHSLKTILALLAAWVPIKLTVYQADSISFQLKKSLYAWLCDASMQQKANKLNNLKFNSDVLLQKVSKLTLRLLIKDESLLWLTTITCWNCVPKVRIQLISILPISKSSVFLVSFL